MTIDGRNAEAIRLEAEIRIYDKAYWKDNKSLIDDPTYDQKTKQLLKIEPNNKYLNRPKAPNVDSQGKVKHIIPMLSLDKAYEWDEIIKFCEKVCRNDEEELTLMYKLDGVSGQFIAKILATRGDGLIGEDITHKLPFIKIITHGEIDNIRGEILLTKSKFKEIKGVITRKSGEDYKNERNAVGGILSRDDIDPVKILEFVDFEYIHSNITYSQLKEYGLEWWNKIIKDAKDSNYPTDGLVLKISDKKYAANLGSTRHHLKSAIAFKFENPYEWSWLRAIEFSPGKHDITPVGKVDPVEVSGITIKSPNLHNWANVLRLDLHIGDLVKVERAGDVIPDITDSKPGENRIPIIIPPCPVCQSEVVYKDPQLQCSNSECPGKLLNKLSDAVIRVGIDELGKPTIKKMMDTLNIEDLIGVFNVTIDDLLKLERFGEKSAENLFNEINKVKTEGIFEWQLLACLNLPGIGRSLSEDLLKERSFLDVSHLGIIELMEIEGIGPERAVVIHSGLFNNEKYLNELTAILPIKKNAPIINDGIKICFTGKFPEKKSYYYEILKERGGYEIMNKVSKDTQILVVADPSKGSNKQKSAEKKGIKILGISELMGDL